jgi:hypothetical protein
MTAVSFQLSRSKGNATPVMQVQGAPNAGITVRAVGCAKGYAPSDSPFATATWNRAARLQRRWP